MDKYNQFSNDKIFFHTSKMKKVLEGDFVEPIVYELSLSGICNCRCEYCCCKDYHSNQMLSVNDIDLLAQQLKDHALAVTITGGGEPLINPNFSYCVQKLKKNGMSVGIITNGLLLEPNIIEAIVMNASFIRISLDTVNNITHKKIRGININIEKLYKDLKLLAMRKKDLGSEILIGSQIVYIDQSIDDIEKTIIFTKSTKIDFIQIRPVDNIPNVHLARNYSFYTKHKRELEFLADKYSDESFKVIINENKFEEYYNGDVNKEYKKCLGANFTASIGHDMNLYFCCSHIGNPIFAIGDLRKNTLRDLLFSEKRKKLINNPCFNYCQTQCRNHKLNKILNQLVNLDCNMRNLIIEEKCKGEIPLHYKFL